MHRCLLALLLVGIVAAARGQEPVPEAPAPLELGGSTEKASLVLNPLGHVGPIQGLFFTPDATRLLTVGADQTAQRWDVGSGERLKVLRLPARPTAAALSPDGKTLALGRWSPPKTKLKKVYLVNLDDGRMLWLSGVEGLQGPIPALAFSPDGDRLAAANATQGGYLWDGLKEVWQREPKKATKKARRFTGVLYIRALAFSPPDGTRIAVGCEWSAAGRKTAYVRHVPLIPGKAPMGVELPYETTIAAVAWTPDGRQVVTVPANQNPGRKGARLIRFNDAAEGTELRQIELGNRMGSGLHFLKAQELLLTWFDGAGVNDQKAGPTGHGQSIFTLTDPPQERKGPFLPGSLAYDANHSALSADGKLAAFSGGPMGEEVVVWDTATGKVLRHLGGKLGTPRSVGWSKDGKSLGLGAIEDKEKGLVFQDALDLKELQLRQKAKGADYLSQVKTSGAWSVLPLPKRLDQNWGRLVLKHGDEKVELKAKGLRTAVTLSPAKEPAWIAWSTEGDPTFRKGVRLGLYLADLRTGEQVQTLLPQKQRVLDLAPSPDGHFLLAVNDQPVAFLYRIADDPAKTDPQPLLYLFASHGDWILWTKEGYYAASLGGERLMGWTVENGPDKLPTFYPAERFRKQLYRPDVIKLVLEKGSVAEALKAADAARGKKTHLANLDELLPPRAALDVLDQSALPTVKLRATATASGKAQPVTALRLLVDGRPLPEGAGHKEFKGEQAATAEWTITLPPGKHSLAVLARSADASSVSPAVELTSAAPPRQAALHVVAVGINAYQDPAIPKLQFAAADARAIAEAFPKHCKGPLFPAVSAKTLLDQEASRKVVLDELAALRKKAGANDLVVVFFAGHGVKEKDRFYLLTADANPDDLASTALSGEDLRQALGEFPCQVLLLLDACHAAAGLKNFRPAVDDVTRTLTEDEVGVAVLCAAMAHEKAEEAGKHGRFTRALVAGLSGVQGVPRNPFNHRLYIHHLHSYVFDRVSAESEDRQHPFLCLPWVVESFALRQLPETLLGGR